MICPTCDGEGETVGESLPMDFALHVTAVVTPCANCLGTGEVPDDLTLEDLHDLLH